MAAFAAINLLLRPTSPGDPIPVQTLQPGYQLLVTGLMLHLAWAGAGGDIVWCLLCKLESPDYHHTLHSVTCRETAGENPAH